jgi:hypothetical protein
MAGRGVGFDRGPRGQRPAPAVLPAGPCPVRRRAARRDAGQSCGRPRPGPAILAGNERQIDNSGALPMASLTTIDSARSADTRALSSTSFITERMPVVAATHRRWLTYLGGRPRCPSTRGSQVGSHRRPTSSQIEPIRALDS